MMAEEGDELGLTVVPTKRRRRYDPAWKARLVAACLEPGASVSRLALEHRVNANLVWKWIQRHELAKQETLSPSLACAPAFIPVHLEEAADGAVSKRDRARALELRPHPGVRQPELERTDLLSSPATVNASLPNGVKLTLECRDVRAVTAIIGALSNVQIGR